MLSDKDYIEKLEQDIENLEYNNRQLQSDYDEVQELEDTIDELESKIHTMENNSVDIEDTIKLRIKSVSSEEIILENNLKPSETLFWLPGRKLGVTEL